MSEWILVMSKGGLPKKSSCLTVTILNSPSPALPAHGALQRESPVVPSGLPVDAASAILRRFGQEAVELFQPDQGKRADPAIQA